MRLGALLTPRWFGALQEAGLLLVILALGVLLTLGADQIEVGGRSVNNFLRLDNLIPNVATTMSWIAIMAIGVTFVIASGGIDISIGSIFGLSALATAAVLQRLDEHASAWVVIPLGLVVAVGVGGLCGAINGGLVVALRMHPFIVTLGTLSIFRGIALVVVPTKSLPSGDRVLPAALTSGFIAYPVEFSRAGAPSIMVQPTPMLLMVAVVLASWIYLAHTVAGREIYAVGGNEEAARYSGVSIGRVKMRVYVASGLLAGFAGLISTGYYGSANTATGEGYELMVIAAAVVGGASLNGGRGAALGAALGALIIKLIENGIFILRRVDFGFFTLTLSKEYSKIIIGVAIILAVAMDRLGEYLRRRSSA